MTASTLRSKNSPFFGTVVLPVLVLAFVCVAACGEQARTAGAQDPAGQAAASAEKEAAPADPAPCRVHLKGGQVLTGRLLADAGGTVVLESADDDALELPWMLVRCVEKEGAPDIYALEPAIEARAGNDAGDGSDSEPAFIRYRSPQKEAPGALETAVQRLHDPAANNDVFLVGVIHVGEPEYFERLQDVLDSMDTVLYEGVGGARGGGDETATLDAILRLQLLLKDFLGLKYQKEALCYDREFWVNSDLSWAEVRAELDRQGLELIPGEKIFALFSDLLFKSWDPSKRDLSPRETARLRRIAARMLGNAEQLFSQLKGLEGMDKVVIKARNNKVVDDLGAWLGRNQNRRTAIFYGAGHMRDLKTKIVERFDLRFAGSEWRQAWTIH